MTKRATATACGAQQGDVLFLPAISALPPGCKLKADGVIAMGEATGHTHRLEEATDGLLYEAPDGRLYLVAGSRGADVVHDEHETVHRPAGIYPIGRWDDPKSRGVQEYDHFAEESRRVVD